MTQREMFQRAAETLLRESGCIVRKWRTTRTGVADVKNAAWEIEVPEPRGPISFGVFAHEVGHQMLHRGRNLPRFVEEVEAEEYALAQFDRFELPGRGKYEKHAARHVGYSFVKAIRRSKILARVIFEAYPEWWEKAEAVDSAALARPSLSSERSALDEESA